LSVSSSFIYFFRLPPQILYTGRVHLPVMKSMTFIV
jgi:hypothetical protein